MTVPTFAVHCLKKKLIAPGVYELQLEKPAGYTFQAGQFVLFDVPMLENIADIQTRAYSIASAPHETDLLFVIKIVPGGRAGKWIEETVIAGTEITMKGPLGAFMLDTKTEKQYIFVGTGTGIAPLRSQIVHALEVLKDMRPMQLLFGVVKHEDLFWEESFKTLEQQFSNFNAGFSVLQDPTDSPYYGAIQDRLQKLFNEVTGTSIYLCGAPELVRTLKQQCLDAGIPKADVHAELYV